MPIRPFLTIIRRWPVAILVLALAAALLVALRITERGEAWLDRTYWLVGIAAFGGFFGATATVMILALRDWRLVRRFPRLATCALFTGCFMLAMQMAYVVVSLWLIGEFEPHPDHPIRGIISAFMQVGAVFLISSPAYLLPWPLPALAVLASLLLPAARRETVEPADDDV